MAVRNRHCFIIEYSRPPLNLRTTRIFNRANLAYEFLEEHLSKQPDIVVVLLETRYPDGNRTYKRISRMSLTDYTGSGNKARILYKGGK